MKKLHKGLIIVGATLAVLVPAGLVAADQIDMGHGPGQGRGNGTMTHDCDRTGTQAARSRSGAETGMQRRDGTGPNHAANSANRPGATSTTTGATGSTTQRQYVPMNGSGRQMHRGG